MAAYLAESIKTVAGRLEELLGIGDRARGPAGAEEDEWLPTHRDAGTADRALHFDTPPARSV